LNVSENLTHPEARRRAAAIGEVSYHVHLDLRTGAETFRSTTRVRFSTTESGTTFLDCTAATVLTVRVDGTAVDGVVEPTRIRLEDLGPGEHTVEVVADMAYQHEGRGLHRFVDPTDDRIYLHSQFEPFDAHLVYACFDQPDLKATFELAVDAPAEWVVVSNAPALQRPEPGAEGRWAFEPTPPIPTYITAVVAGPYASVHESHGSIEMGLYVRRSLERHLDAAEIFEVTRQGLDFFARVFDQPYPFGDKYDQLFVPEFSAGAMENPGCITFTEAYVFRSKVTDATRERRAETILHEMAHMWFGDLVTMRWWDDLWLNESFATFMAVLAQAEATRWDQAWTTFLDAEKAWAKYQDQLPSTHPVADSMPDVESVHQNFDGITYAKGASVLRQLVAWVGQEEFLAGCRDYFARHAWGNTELEDFLGALERASGRDLGAWRDEWLLTTGLNVLSGHAEVGPDGTYTTVAVTQVAPLPAWAGVTGTEVTEQPLRRHRVTIGVYDDTTDGLVRRERVELDVDGASTPVPKLVGVEAGDVLLVNDEDLTYAKVTLDEASTAVLTGRLHRLVDPLPRAQVWSATWDMVRDAELAAGRYVELVVRNVEHETEVGVLQRLLHRALGAAERYAEPAHRTELVGRLATHARRQLETATPGSDLQLAWARHWASGARADVTELADLGRVVDGELTFEGLEVDLDLRWHMVVQLARAGAIDRDRIDDELRRDPTDLGERQAATARAALPDPAEKEAVFDRLLGETGLSHTMSRQLWSGFNQLDQAEVLAPFAERYFEVLDRIWEERSLDWAIEFSTAMFPHPAASDDLLARVDETLADDGLAGPLRRVLLEQRDVLVRTLAARQRDALSR
jgi:aminopeptidase N